MPIELVARELTKPVHDQPSTPLDYQILEVLGQSEKTWRPGEIAQRIDTHHKKISARLKVLTDRELVIRLPVPGGPQRGPGAFLYRLP